VTVCTFLESCHFDFHILRISMNNNTKTLLKSIIKCQKIRDYFFIKTQIQDRTKKYKNSIELNLDYRNKIVDETLF